MFFAKFHKKKEEKIKVKVDSLQIPLKEKAKVLQHATILDTKMVECWSALIKCSLQIPPETKKPKSTQNNLSKNFHVCYNMHSIIVIL